MQFPDLPVYNTPGPFLAQLGEELFSMSFSTCVLTLAGKCTLRLP